MFYYKFVFFHLFVYFTAFLVLTLNGFFMIREKSFRHPLKRSRHIEGVPAVFSGAFLIIIGIYCLMLIIAPFIFDSPDQSLIKWFW
ncbi:hypothetical protein ACFL7D_07335 [candidate division KSB1 bacterium]